MLASMQENPLPFATAGRGFIALVVMMLGQSHPLGILASSLLFGFMDAINIRLQGY